MLSQKVESKTTDKWAKKGEIAIEIKNGYYDGNDIDLLATSISW